MTPLGAGSGHRRPSPLAGPVQAGADQLRGQPGRPRAGGGRNRTRPGAQPRRGPAGLLLDWERPDELWAVTDQGNLWRSNDAGASWRRAGKIDGQPEAFLAQNSACMWRWPTRHRDLDRPGPQLAGAVPGSPTGRIAARQSGGRDRDAGRGHDRFDDVQPTVKYSSTGRGGVTPGGAPGWGLGHALSAGVPSPSQVQRRSPRPAVASTRLAVAEISATPGTRQLWTSWKCRWRATSPHGQRQ